MSSNQPPSSTKSQTWSTLSLIIVWLLVWFLNNAILYGPSASPAALGLIAWLPIGWLITGIVIVRLQSLINRTSNTPRKVGLIVAALLIIGFGVLPVAIIENTIGNFTHYSFEIP